MKIKTLRFCAALTVGATTAAAQGTAPRVALETSEGRIVIELAPKEAPKTVDNFLAYVKAGHYDGTVFHRVIPTFMVQGGGFGPDMSERSTRPPIALESKNGLKNTRGTRMLPVGGLAAYSGPGQEPGPKHAKEVWGLDYQTVSHEELEPEDHWRASGGSFGPYKTGA